MPISAGYQAHRPYQLRLPQYAQNRLDLSQLARNVSQVDLMQGSVSPSSVSNTQISVVAQTGHRQH